MAKSCPVGQVYNTNIGKCVKKKGGQKQKMPIIKNETPLRLESLVPIGKGPRGMTMSESREVGKRRKGVSDPRFHRARGDKKKDPIDLVGRAIAKDKQARRYKKIKARAKAKKKK